MSFIPDEIESKLYLMIFLLPGFVTVAIISMIVDLGSLTEIQITYYSLILSLINIFISIMIIWVFFLPIKFLINCILRIVRMFFSIGVLPYKFKIISFGIIVITVSALTGIGLGIVAEKDILFVKLRDLPITNVISKRSFYRPSTFILNQNSTGQMKKKNGGDARPEKLKKTEGWIKVNMKDGMQYEGYPEFYENGQKPTELYLSPACEINTKYPEYTLKKIPGAGIIIYESEIVSIMLIDRESSSCYKAWFGKEP